MSTTLYRKYRPQLWKDITNQNHIKITLQSEVATGRISHAYLFTGPHGVGKTTTARLLAKTLNCEHKTVYELRKIHGDNTEPCNKCHSCVEITTGNSLDLIEIDAASHTGVDNVRENIIDSSKVHPAKNKYKVFIIDEVHMLSASAFSALLKILEEPPTNVIFILATTNIYDVPDTIISRCQRFNFIKLSLEEIKCRLQSIAQSENIEIDDNVLAAIAEQAAGSVRDAESILGQVLALGEHKITLEIAELIIPKSNTNLVINLVDYLISCNAEAAIGLINKLVDDGVNINIFTKELIEFLRKLLLIKTGLSLDKIFFNTDSATKTTMVSLASKIETNRLLKLLTLLVERLSSFNTSPIVQLPLEMIVMEFISE